MASAEYHRAWYRAHIHKRRSQSRARYRQHHRAELKRAQKYRKTTGYIEAQRRYLESGAKSLAHIKCRYGLSPEQYKKMFEVQDGKCAVCKREATLVIDHSHSSGKVRGLVCHRCNAALVPFDDAHLKAAIEAYLA